MIINLHNTRKFWAANSVVFLLLLVFHIYEGEKIVYVLSIFISLPFAYRLKKSFTAKRMNDTVFASDLHSILEINEQNDKIRRSEAYRQIYFAFGQNIYEQYFVMYRNYALVIIMFGAITNWAMISISLWLLSMTFAHSNKRGYPAFALVLGSSSSSISKELALRVGKAVQPLNCVSFLEFFTGNNIDDAAEYYSGIRWVSEVMPWEVAVKANITTCKFIILDATKATEHIETELKYISSENLWYKTIIAGTPDAAMVLTEFVETGIRNGACVGRELNDVIYFIEKSRSMLKVPTPTMHISDLYHG